MQRPTPPFVLPLVMVMAAARPAEADEAEASLHVEVGPAFLWVGDDASWRGETKTAGAGRLSVRGTWGWSDTCAVELGVAGLAGGAARFPGPAAEGSMQELRQETSGVRATAGATARLGVAWIPTLTGFLGYQHRWLHERTLRDRVGVVTQPLSSQQANDLILGVGAGFDYRLNAHWIIGISVQVLHAFALDGSSFNSVEVPVMASYYWYPRWDWR